MDWNAFHLSLQLAAWTLVLLLPIGIVTGRWLAKTQTRARPWLQAFFALPLVLPPTVIGYYLLVFTGTRSPIGEFIMSWFGVSLVFSFPGLVVASILVNLPFAILPVQRLAFGEDDSDESEDDALAAGEDDPRAGAEATRLRACHRAGAAWRGRRKSRTCCRTHHRHGAVRALPARRGR